MNKLTEIEKAYLAGFMDGEGCIHISRGYDKKGISVSCIYTLRVLIAQAGEKGKEILTYWQEKVGLGIVVNQDRKNDKWKSSHTWIISTNHAAAFLASILPYLIIKKEEAEIAIKFQAVMKADGKNCRRGYVVPKSVIAQRDAIYTEMRRLKKENIEEGDEQIEIDLSPHWLQLSW